MTSTPNHAPKPLDADRLELVLQLVGIAASPTAELELRQHIAYLSARLEADERLMRHWYSQPGVSSD